MNPIWPFSRRPREAKSALPLVAVTEIGAARWGSREGAALTRDGYLANAVAYRAVRMVAEAAALVPLVSAQAGAAQLIRQATGSTVRCGSTPTGWTSRWKALARARRCASRWSN